MESLNSAFELIEKGQAQVVVVFGARKWHHEHMGNSYSGSWTKMIPNLNLMATEALVPK